MIYFSSGQIVIRDLMESDAEIITQEEIAQGWNQTVNKYLARLSHQRQGLCVALVAEYQGQIAGYINIYRESKSCPYQGQSIPEIVDFGVLEKYRRLGIGSLLMDQAEKIALQYGNTVVLGVGLHAGYGSAQRMYAKRGYIPDGSGVWYGDQPCQPYAEYPNDDDFVLYLTKSLR